MSKPLRSSSPAPPTPVLKTILQVPEEDKKEARAAKFGILTEKSVEDKKAARAAKFAAEKKEATDDKAAVSICYL